MECLFINEYWTHLLMNYGSIVLFILLAMGIIALPIPEETLLVFAGALMGKGVLMIPATILSSIAGSMSGITVSYMIGTTGGIFLVHKYGKWVGITDKRLKKAHDWFERYGKWTLFVGYFIPGVRHFTGISAGISGLEYSKFALFAYSGAVVWVLTFLSIGYFFGHVCFSFLEEIDSKTVMIIGSIAMLIVGYAIVNKFTKKKNSHDT